MIDRAASSAADHYRRSRKDSRRRAARVRAAANAAGMVAGFALDRVIGDPRRGHPVAGYGRIAGALERKMYAPQRDAGARFAGIAIGIPVAAAAVAALVTRRRPVARAAVTAVTTWAVLGAMSLRREAEAMADALEDGDLAEARRRLPNLCGRDPARLGESELARAAVESVAENASDAVVAPLVWGALFGLPGLVGYRAANTIDAMVGHRSSRYEQFGMVAARIDDAANLVPSRFTAGLFVAGAPLVEGSPMRAASVWFRDGNRHPSPNAGQCESAMAGALGVRLGGRNVYFGREEHRPQLGQGPGPGTRDLRRAARLADAAGLAAMVLCAGHVLWRPWRRHRSS
jgi:adenosylcobinamide-phosphate synthase